MKSRIPARVLACLSADTVRVILMPNAGSADGGIPTDLPRAWFPPDLCQPNSEVVVVMDAHNATGIERANVP